MTIGLIILMAVSGSYVNGLAMQRTHTDVSHLQESGRFAFELIARSVRHAGYRNTYAVVPDTATGGLPSEFCSTGPTGSQLFGLNDAAAINPAAANLAGTAVTVINGSDVLRVRYFGEDNDAGTAADGSVLDCLGNAVRRGGNASVPVEDTLYVAVDSTSDPANPQPALFCRSSTAGGLGTPLIPGVESMQVLYGEDIDADGRVDRYLPYSGVSNPDNVFNMMVSLVLLRLSREHSTTLVLTMRRQV
jgi:type IV pilus assembly protein PilW